MRIEGRGVYLRPAELADYPQWSALRKASADYLSAMEPDWSEDALSLPRYERRLAGEARARFAGHGYVFLIFRNAGELVGGLTLGPVAGVSAMLGTWIGAPFVGRGYAIRAVQAAIGFAWRLGLDRVDATVLPDNRASIRGLEYLGFELFPRRVSLFDREHLVYCLTRKI